MSGRSFIDTSGDRPRLRVGKFVGTLLGVASFGWLSGAIEAIARFGGGLNSTLVSIGRWFRFDLIGVCWGVPCGEDSLVGMAVAGLRQAFAQNVAWVESWAGAFAIVVVTIEIVAVSALLVLLLEQLAEAAGGDG